MIFFAIITFTLVQGAEFTSIRKQFWENLHIAYDSRVAGLETWVNLKASNANQCFRMCWLFTACSAVTFNFDQQRCLLHPLPEDDYLYRTAPEIGSLAADFKDATPAQEKKYGCDRRPCSETEMCAPIKNHASHLCIPLMSVFCSDDPPVVPNSEMLSDGVGFIVYTCAYGYYRAGNVHISTCDRDTGAWSDVDVTCTFVDCGAPPDLHGAKNTIKFELGRILIDLKSNGDGSAVRYDSESEEREIRWWEAGRSRSLTS
ncbi:hypothetical protein ElyMa_000406700 [Elysia marginata]|uniref:Apple domain-containing protein n=1 Tax=Elysia marginata TaxID=1093978 RepID=A0AAV4FL82_9GAST|nr:hypothetical protein ElyMa_000406700 [Elysia marginata]